MADLTYTSLDTYRARLRAAKGLAVAAIRALLVILEARVDALELHPFVKSGTITWSGSGASLATTVTGVLSTDKVFATIRVAPTQAAYIVSVAPTTDTITIVLSAANTSNQAQISYAVMRALT